MDITHLLALSIKEGASDLHLSAGLPPILRIDGDLVRMDLPVLRPKQVDELVNEVLNETQIKALKNGIEIDFHLKFQMLLDLGLIYLIRTVVKLRFSALSPQRFQH